MKTDTQKNILIIDDHRLFAEGLALILSSIDKTLTATTTSNPRYALSDSQDLSSYDFLIIDLQMPSMNGFTFLQALTTRKISIPTLVVSSTENRSDIENALKFGARGFVPKKSPPHEIIKAIKSVLAGNVYVPEYLVGFIDWNFGNKTTMDDSLSSDQAVTLSERQSEIIALIQSGHSNALIGEILNLTESTVKGHISSLFKVLHVKNRTACVNKALTLGLLKPIREELLTL